MGRLCRHSFLRSGCRRAGRQGVMMDRWVQQFFSRRTATLRDAFQHLHSLRFPHLFLLLNGGDEIRRLGFLQRENVHPSGGLIFLLRGNRVLWWRATAILIMKGWVARKNASILRLAIHDQAQNCQFHDRKDS